MKACPSFGTIISVIEKLGLLVWPAKFMPQSSLSKLQYNIALDGAAVITSRRGPSFARFSNSTPGKASDVLRVARAKTKLKVQPKLPSRIFIANILRLTEKENKYLEHFVKLA